MARYRYTAKDRSGATIKGEDEASSGVELANKVRARGLFITSIAEVGGAKKGLLKPKIKKGKHSSVKGHDLALLARNLSTTLSAGITLLRSLEIISVQTESFALENILRSIVKDVKGGLSLSEALKKYPRVFSVLWLGLIEAGEASGNLPYVLDQLAAYLELRMGFERKIKSALVYPVIVFGVVVIASFFFFKVILPRFIEIFDQFDVPLPVVTDMLFGATRFINANMVPILIGFLLLAGALWYYLKSPGLMRTRERVTLRLPIVGGLAMVSNLERFSSSMYILLESGVPMIYTLEIAGKSSGTVLGDSIEIVKENVRGGNPLSSELDKSGLFPILVVEMARIGEETGNMPDMFKKISSHYRDDLVTKIDRLTAAFEPLIILVLGVVIGAIVISLYLPIFKLTSIGLGGS